MRLVAGQQALQHVTDGGGNVYLWPRGIRCCAGRSYVLEASTEPPAREVVPLGEQDGIAVWATPGLQRPDEVQLELDRRGRLRAFWNGQGWIG
jgi:hypothetical protein